MRTCLHYLKFMTGTLLILPVISILNLQAQDSEYKDAPYFTGMPNYVIDYAEDIEFDEYHFYNGTNCPIVEGKKFLRQYVFKEGEAQASQLQIVQNYAYALRSIGGTVFKAGILYCYECDNDGMYLMVGKFVKDGHEVWVEVLPGNDGYNYRLIEVIKGVMIQDVKVSDIQDVKTSDMLQPLNRDSHGALPVGDINSIKSILQGDLKDVDSNFYRTILIGNQMWMAENLKTTKFNDGTGMFEFRQMNWRYGVSNTHAPAYGWYDDRESPNKDKYGALYNWNAVSMGNLCPTGWHIPTSTDWETLISYLEANGFGTTASENIAKSLADPAGWTSSTTAGAPGNTDYPAKINASGFSGLPGGYVTYQGYKDLGKSTYWWTGGHKSLQVNGLYFDYASFEQRRFSPNDGDYVRCVKDSIPLQMTKPPAQLRPEDSLH
jgi:uncharacterized protein (TIGR02145 family)